MLRVFPGVERSAGCGHAHGVSKRGKRHGMKWGARQEEVSVAYLDFYIKPLFFASSINIG